jgi:hypothetical protein
MPLIVILFLIYLQYNDPYSIIVRLQKSYSMFSLFFLNPTASSCQPTTSL